MCQCRMDMNEVECCSGQVSSKAPDREHAAEYLSQMADGKAWLHQGPGSAGKLGVNRMMRPGNFELAFRRLVMADLHIWGHRWVLNEAFQGSQKGGLLEKELRCWIGTGNRPDV